MSTEEAETIQVVDTQEGEGTISVGTNFEEALNKSNEEPNTNENQETINMPEKFANAENPQEALLKAYLELEKNNGTTDTGSDAPTGEGEGDGERPPAGREVENGASEEFSIEAYQKKWAENQSLSDEDWAVIQANTKLTMEELKGYENYVLATNKAQLDQTIAENDQRIYNTLGGRDAYDQMIAWANDNLSDTQIQGLNAGLDNPLFSENTAVMLKTLYDNGATKEPAVNTATIPSSDIVGTQDRFMSRQEALEFQKSEKYRSGDARTHAEYDKKMWGLMTYEANKA